MTEKRPAHRPSRRQDAIDAALRLQAMSPQSAVTVGRIAKEAGMTPAAIYYHYDGRDDILAEGLAAFADELRDEMAAFLAAGEPADLPRHLLRWFDERGDAAVVWFVNSGRLSARLEGLRRSANEDIITALSRRMRQGSGVPIVHASILAAALLSLIEVGARRWLGAERETMAAEPDGFFDEVDQLAARIVATPVPATA